VCVLGSWVWLDLHFLILHYLSNGPLRDAESSSLMHQLTTTLRDRSLLPTATHWHGTERILDYPQLVYANTYTTAEL
jgi:hypothetical protein